jgi:hypothetical protein
MQKTANLQQSLMLTLTGKYGFSHGEVESILPHISLHSASRNQIVKPYVHYESKLRIILSGIGGYFVRNNKGDDLCFYFAMPGELFTDFKSLFDQKISRIELRAIKKLETADIDRDIFVQFTEKKEHGEIIRREATEMLFADTLEHYLDLLTLTAVERYKLLFDKHPEFIEHIDDLYLASYLGIKPQSLSRIKNQFLKTRDSK